MYRIIKLEQTCEACPSQWNAWAATGELIYIRYRWGYLSVQVGGFGGTEILGEDVGDGMSGCMEEGDMKRHTREVLWFD